MSLRITEAEFLEWLGEVKPYTMVAPQRLMALVHALENIVADGILGDIVECGVWRDGAVMLAARCCWLWMHQGRSGCTTPSRA